MMKKDQKFILILVFLISISCSSRFKHDDIFVKVEGGDFYINEREYTFLGANYWQGMNLGAPVSGNQKRLIRELDHLKSIGITNLRILASSEGDAEMRYCVHPALQVSPGKYDDDVFKGLDFLLSEMAKREMKAVMVLGNFWTWSGGFSQYLRWVGAGDIPYPQEPPYSWKKFTDYSKLFYSNNDAQKLMENHFKTIINRKNSYTGRIYKNDPTIMAWQLANEPRGYDVSAQFRRWAEVSAKFIKSIDCNHLVCLGTEGNTPSSTSGVNAMLDNDNPYIDYITMHIWVQNWSWFTPGQSDSVYSESINKVNDYWKAHIEVAHKLNKPIVLEEFGIARDGCSYSPDATTVDRDSFYSIILKKVQASVIDNDRVKGVNFWSYSGEGRPVRPGEYWRQGDIFLGDPPHELQGWYGVYDTDSSTIKVVRAFAEKINSFHK